MLSFVLSFCYRLCEVIKICFSTQCCQLKRTCSCIWLQILLRFSLVIRFLGFHVIHKTLQYIYFDSIAVSVYGYRCCSCCFFFFLYCILTLIMSSTNMRTQSFVVPLFCLVFLSVNGTGTITAEQHCDCGRNAVYSSITKA